MNSHAVKPEIALSVRDLSVRHWRDGQAVKVVSDLSFNLHAGEALAVAGESGSGKTQTFLAAMGLLAPGGQAHRPSNPPGNPCGLRLCAAPRLRRWGRPRACPDRLFTSARWRKPPFRQSMQALQRGWAGYRRVRPLGQGRRPLQPANLVCIAVPVHGAANPLLNRVVGAGSVCNHTRTIGYNVWAGDAKQHCPFPFIIF